MFKGSTFNDHTRLPIFCIASCSVRRMVIFLSADDRQQYLDLLSHHEELSRVGPGQLIDIAIEDC